jgi:hypothetical protein
VAEAEVSAVARGRGQIFEKLEEDFEEEEGDLPDSGPVRKGKGRRLVRDPKTGKVFAEKRRKQGRRRPDWEGEVGRWTEDELADTLGFREEDFLGDYEDEFSERYRDEEEAPSNYVAGPEDDEEESTSAIAVAMAEAEGDGAEDDEATDE